MDISARIIDEEVIRVIESMGLSKSSGPSRLGPVHWRSIQVRCVPEILTQAFKEILSTTQRRRYVRSMVPPGLSPKDDTGQAQAGRNQ